MFDKSFFGQSDSGQKCAALLRRCRAFWCVHFSSDINAPFWITQQISAEKCAHTKTGVLHMLSPGQNKHGSNITAPKIYSEYIN